MLKIMFCHGLSMFDNQLTVVMKAIMTMFKSMVNHGHIKKAWLSMVETMVGNGDHGQKHG